MIAYLNGTIQKKLSKSLIVNIQNIGYLVYIPAPLLEKTNEKQKIELYIHTKVREDDISLYGFENFSELEFFKLLLDVNGIGPKLALEIVSHHPDKAKLAILNGDITFLSKIPGIGKKTAERLILELKNKIHLVDIDPTIESNKKEENLDAISALETLGYQRFEILRILKNLPEEIIDTEAVVTYFLRNV